MVKFFWEKCQTLVQKLNIGQSEKGEQGNLCIKIKKKILKNHFYYFSDPMKNLMISTKISKKPAF